MRLIICIIFVFVGSLAFSHPEETDLGSIVNQVADGIKPEAFKGKFSKGIDDWKNANAGLGGLEVKDFKGQLGALVGGLKGKAFEGVSKGGLLTQLTGVNGKSGMKDFLNSFISGLNPEMLTDAFKGNKDKILNSLSEL